MSADPNANVDGEPDGSDGNVDIKTLREAAKQGKAAQSENEQLKRELAFAKAGVDTDSKIGSMLFKAWDGDPNDVEALKAEWAELNPGTGQQQSTAPPETAPTPPGFQDPAAQQQHRESITGQGTPSGEQPKVGPDPYDAAFEKLNGNLALPLENRQEAAISEVLGAYFQGDARVMFDRDAHLAAAAAASREDVDPGA